MIRRAESLDTQRLVLTSQQAGWPAQEILWQFHTNNWGTAAMEARSHFGLTDRDFRGLLLDPSANSRALDEYSPPLLLGLFSESVLSDVQTAMRDNAEEAGWQKWLGPGT